MIFFSADHHFFHDKIINYCFRPFNNISEMNNKLIENWNSVVKPSDTIYYLGDLTLCNNKKLVRELLSSLNGNIYLVQGDHDKNSLNFFPERFNSVNWFYEIKPYKDIPTISLTHWCMRVWPKSHYNSWHCYAHSHGCLPSIGKSHDVGVDNNNFTPISLDELVEIMKFKEDNFNLIKPKKEDPHKFPQVEIEFVW